MMPHFASLLMCMHQPLPAPPNPFCSSLVWVPAGSRSKSGAEAGSRWFGGWTDGHTRQQEIWQKEKLQSSVPNRALCWEIPATLTGTILGVRQHVHIWRVLGFF